MTNGVVLIRVWEVICSVTRPRLRCECQRKQLRFVRRSRQRGAGSRSAFPGERASAANSNTAGTRSAGGSAKVVAGGRFTGFIDKIYSAHDSDLTQCTAKQHGAALTTQRLASVSACNALECCFCQLWLAGRLNADPPLFFHVLFWQVSRRKVLRV